MRIVNVNLNSGKSISASIKSSQKTLMKLDSRNRETDVIPNSDIKSIDVIADGKMQEIPVEKFWNYDAIVNILGDED
jgi:spermidine/putrescine-binding protein